MAACTTTRERRGALRALTGFLVLATIYSGCSGGGSGGGGGGATAVTGVAVDGRVLGGAGKLLHLGPDGTAIEVGDVTTGALNGALSFTSNVPGPSRIRLTSGTYTDGATGSATALTASSPLEAIFVAGGAAQTVHVTPLTSVAARLLDERLLADPTLTVDAALVTALNAAVATAFGVVDADGNPADVTAIQPLDLTFEADAQAFAADPGSAQARYGLLLGGLAQVAEGAGFADVPALVAALARDAADGAFDGQDASGQPVANLGSGTVTADLAQGIETFLLEAHVADTFASAGEAPPDPAALPDVQALQDEVTAGAGSVPLPPVAGAPTPGGITLAGLAAGFINAATDEALVTAIVALPPPATPALVGDTIRLDVSDVAGNVTSSVQVVDAGALSAGRIDFADPGTAGLVEGPVLFTARLRRTSGSATSTSIAVSTTALKDETPAQSTVTAPAAGALVGAAGALLRAQVSGTGSGVASVSFEVGGQTIATRTSAPFTVSFEPLLTTLADGAHDVVATATDRAGNAPTPSAAVSITLDTTAPTGSLDPDPSGQVVFGAAQAVSASTLDAVGLAAATFTLTDGAGASASAEVALGGVGTPSATASTTLDTTGLSDGAATLTLALRDAAGNVRTTAATAQVTILNEAPAFTSAAPLAATVGQLYTYTVTATGLQVTLVAPTLPASGWLSFDAGTGTLSGTPLVGDVGANDVELTATNPRGQATQSFTIQVAPAGGGGGPGVGIWDQATWDSASWGQ